MTTIFWIETPSPGRIGVLHRPAGGERLPSEVTALKSQGVEVVVSLLTEPEVHELGLLEEAALCSGEGLDFVSFPIGDRRVPESVADFAEVATRLHRLVRQGRSVAIHGRHGLGRSSLMAASLLVSLGLGTGEAFTRIEQVRGHAIPDTEEQHHWVRSFARALSARQGG